jgi:hypothetical protein
MGTRASIRIEYKDNTLCDKYINMDGHIENWAPQLIVALNQTTPSTILKNRKLLKFMFEGYFGGDNLDYKCVIDISNDCYNIKIYRFDALIFEGTLEEFSDKYDDI